MTKYKSFRSIAAFAVLAAASCVAFATDCKNGAPHSSWPDCILPGQPGTTTNNAGGGGGGGGGVGVGIAGAEALGFGGGATVSTGPVNASGIGGDLSLSPEQRQQMQQQQAQQQRQGQGQTSTNVNNISTGSNGSYSSSYTAWVPPSLNVQASVVPSAFMQPIVRRCDARVHKVSEPVYGVAFGPAGGQSAVPLGRRDDIQPVFYNWDGTIGDPFEVVGIWGYDPNGRRAIIAQQLMGHEVYGNAAVISSSTSRGINFFGAHETTGGGLGVAGSGAMQQMTQQLTVFPCVYRTRYVEWTIIQQKTVIAAPKPRPPKPKVYVAPKPKPCIPVQNICRNEGSSSITGLSNTQIK